MGIKNVYLKFKICVVWKELLAFKYMFIDFDVPIFWYDINFKCKYIKTVLWFNIIN